MSPAVPPSGHSAPPPAACVLSVQGLTLRGPRGASILDELSFDLQTGEVVALVGESGSGKTMAGRAVLRLLPPQVQRLAWRIEVTGHEVHALSSAELRALRGADAGMVFQEPMVSLNPALTIGKQLTESLLLHRGISLHEARQRATVMLQQVQIADPERCLAAHPHQFSGGMRQRIMLASVMLLAPKLLIADEPTTALDSLTQREVLELLTGLTRAAGTAVLLITHDLGLVARHASRVVVLQKGRCVEQGAARQVLLAPAAAYTRCLIEALPQRRPPPPLAAAAAPLIEARALAIDFAGARSGWLGLLGRAAPKRVVNDVSLAVQPGEVVALVGGSGSGKTTLGRAMLGLLPLAAGSVHYRGQPVAAADAAQRRRFRLDCQLVFQDPYSSLNPRQRIGDAVGEPLRHATADEPVLAAAERRDRVEAMLEEVGLKGFAGRYPHALSGGQRQRVAIARALIRKPAFVVADEPVSALDMTIQKQVLELFRRLQQERGFACLFVTHNLAVVGEVARRVVVMNGGRIVEQGPVAAILDDPKDDYTRQLLLAATSSDLLAQMKTHSNERNALATPSAPAACSGAALSNAGSSTA